MLQLLRAKRRHLRSSPSKFPYQSVVRKSWSNLRAKQHSTNTEMSQVACSGQERQQLSKPVRRQAASHCSFNMLRSFTPTSNFHNFAFLHLSALRYVTPKEAKHANRRIPSSGLHDHSSLARLRVDFILPLPGSGILQVAASWQQISQGFGNPLTGSPQSYQPSELQSLSSHRSSRVCNCCIACMKACTRRLHYNFPSGSCQEQYSLSLNFRIPSVVLHRRSTYVKQHTHAECSAARITVTTSSLFRLQEAIIRFHISIHMTIIRKVSFSENKQIFLQETWPIRAPQKAMRDHQSEF